MARTQSPLGDLLACCVSGLLLLLYPAEFRDTFGPDMRQYLQRQRAERRYKGARGGVRYLFDVLSDTVVTGLRLRVRQLRTRPSESPRRVPHMQNLIRDLRFGSKLLWKEKALTLTVLLTLAVCVGANTAIFSVINTVLLEPLPFSQSDRLVTLFNSYPNAGDDHGLNAAPDFFFRRERVEAFEEVAAYTYSGNTVGESGNTERVSTMMVTPSFFPTLRVLPFLGRTFTEDEMELAAANKVILGHGFWQDQFGSNPSVMGQELRIDGRVFEIVGVLPEDFRFLDERETRLYIPIPFRPRDRTTSQLHNNSYNMIARLRPGATIEQASSQIGALDLALAEDAPFPNYKQLMADVGYHVQIHNLRDYLLRGIRQTFILIWVGVAFVLLIGCVNIANLMLARSNARMKEMATRIALGADRRRLCGQLLTEAVFLALIGGALGLALGAAGLRLIRTLGLEDLPRGSQIGLDGGAVVFTIVVALSAGIIFGAIPLLHLFRTDLNSVFRAESRTGTATRHTMLLRSVLGTGQVSIAFVLLIGAGLMSKSLREALIVDPGFKPDSILTGYLSLPDSRYPDGASRSFLVDDVLREVRALPGVVVASVTSQIPFSGGTGSAVIIPEGYIPRPGESLLAPWRSVVGPGYFEAMRIPLIEGRFFRESDDADGLQTIIIDEWLAQRFYPNESALGKRLFRGAPGTEDGSFLYTIVGIVGDIKQNDLTESESRGAYYFTYKQMPRGFFTLAVQTEVEPLTLTGSIRDAVARVDPDLPFYYPQTMERRVSDSLVVRRTPMLLLTIFASIALFLAAVGIYGVLAYSVAQRTRELGIRLAMGSTAQGVFRLVVSQGLRVLCVGLLIGLVGAVALVRLIQSLLFGVQATDPAVLASVAVILVVVGMTACVLPARRATRIDPVEALAAD